MDGWIDGRTDGRMDGEEEEEDHDGDGDCADICNHESVVVDTCGGIDDPDRKAEPRALRQR